MIWFIFLGYVVGVLFMAADVHWNFPWWSFVFPGLLLGLISVFAEINMGL